jgi:hypothetical protein
LHLLRTRAWQWGLRGGRRELAAPAEVERAFASAEAALGGAGGQPDGLIFHCSRCGSTAICNGLRAVRPAGWGRLDALRALLI